MSKKLLNLIFLVSMLCSLPCVAMSCLEKSFECVNCVTGTPATYQEVVALDDETKTKCGCNMKSSLLGIGVCTAITLFCAAAMPILIAVFYEFDGCTGKVDSFMKAGCSVGNYSLTNCSLSGLNVCDRLFCSMSQACDGRGADISALLTLVVSGVSSLIAAALLYLDRGCFCCCKKKS